MKFHLYLSLLFCLPFIGNSQVYTTQIDSLNVEIEKSVKNQDYDQASEQKSKRDLYVRLEEAVKNNDFDTAQKLKDQIHSNADTPSPAENDIIKAQSSYQFQNKDLGIRVGATFPASIEQVNSNSTFVKQRKAIATKGDLIYELVIQMSMPVNLPRTLEKELNAKISNKRKYITNRRRVLEFDLEFQDNYAKIKAVNRKKGVTWMQVTSKTHVPTDAEVKEFFDSFTINEIDLIEKDR